MAEDEILDELRAKADAFLDLAQRSQADFANYKRRVEAEREADAERARQQTIAELLPLFDDVERAVSQIPPELAQHPWTKGVAMLPARLQHALDRYGLVRVGRVGESFDPSIHEAIGHEPRPGAEPGTVAEVYRSGYRVGERLVRPAQVVVAAEPRHIDQRV